MKVAGQRLVEMGVEVVVIKGGHLAEKDGNSEIINYIASAEKSYALTTKKLPIINPHGVGCTFSSAIAANLAKGMAIFPAIHRAQDYLYEALKATSGWKVGNGRTPVNHFYEGENLIDS